LAADYPRLVSRLILLGVAGPVHRSNRIAALTDRAFDLGLSPAERLEAVQRSFFAKGHDARAWQDGWYLAAATAQRAADARTPLAHWWSGGSVPILAVQGSEDLVALPENAWRLARDFPDRVRLVMLPAAGHAMLPEQPRRLIKAITLYLKSPP
jgi:pimeloyl-ACP methyl ester carboxylesterase